MGEIISLKNPNFSDLLSDGLWCSYRSGTLTDVVLECSNGVEFAVHRLIVTIMAPAALQQLTNQSSSCPIHIDDRTFSYLLEYMYKGQIALPKDQLMELRRGAEQMRLTSLIQCIDCLDVDINLMKVDQQETSNSEAEVEDRLQRRKEIETRETQDDKKAETDENDFDGGKCRTSEPCDTKMTKEVTKRKLKPTSENYIFKRFYIKCDFCDFKTAIKEFYLRHVSRKHGIKCPQVHFRCPHCDFTTSDKKVIAVHRRVEHSRKRRKFQCGNCDFVTGTYRVYSRHVQNSHSTDRPYACQHCDYRSKTLGDLGKHERCHSGKKFKCSVCGRILGSKEILRDHMKLHSMPKVAPDKSHFCQFCTFRTAYKHSLVSHMRIIHSYVAPPQPVKPQVVISREGFHCGRCEYNTVNHRNFVNHLAVKHEVDESGEMLEPKFGCKSCEFKGLSATQLSTHVLLSHKEKSFRCEYCDFTAISKCYITYHTRRKHLDHRPFVCETCGLRFANSGRLCRHAQIHGDKKFVCQMCNNSYSLKAYLIKHVKLMHVETEPKFMCHACPFKTKTKDALQQHFKRMHSDNRPPQRKRKSRSNIQR